MRADSGTTFDPTTAIPYQVVYQLALCLTQQGTWERGGEGKREEGRGGREGKGGRGKRGGGKREGRGE